MTFHELLHRLRELVQQLSRDGLLTERSLARAAGISQPHLHNVLHGTRGLTPELADRLLEALGVSLLELFEVAELEAALERATWPGTARERLAARLTRQLGVRLLSATPEPDDTFAEPPEPFAPR